MCAGMTQFSRQMPRARPTPPPPPPRADVNSAAWEALPLPLSPAFMRPRAREHMAALADFCAVLALTEADDQTPLEQRLGFLDMLELALSGAFGPAQTRPELQAAVTLRQSLLKTGGSFQDMLALSDACRDTLKGALPRTLAAFRDHAARAGAPVLRHFLLLHEERDEAFLSRADDMARWWFALRHQAARLARPDAGLPEADEELRAESARQAAGLWRNAGEKHARAQLLRLELLARRLSGRLARGGVCLAPRGAAPLLPPAEVLVRGAISAPHRAIINLRAWLTPRA